MRFEYLTLFRAGFRTQERSERSSPLELQDLASGSSQPLTRSQDPRTVGPVERRAVRSQIREQKNPQILPQRTLRDLVRLEEVRGVEQPCRQLDWNLSGVVWAWVEGAPFAELRRYSDASEGDVVRALRQAIEIDPRQARAIPSTKGVLGGSL